MNYLVYKVLNVVMKSIFHSILAIETTTFLQTDARAPKKCPDRK